MKLTALVPIKSNSERLANKNFLPFCGQPLYQIVLDKLETIDLIHEIVINTDSEIIQLDCAERYSKVRILERPMHLLGNEVTMNSIIEYDLGQISGTHFLQTHCTNPLLSRTTIIAAIQQYQAKLDVFDSLLSVESIQKRAYLSDGTPINHRNEVLAQTQHLPSINIENSNIFLFSRMSFLNAGNSRIGLRPQLFPMSGIEGMDIDYEADFVLAELIAKHIDLFRKSD